MANVAGTGHQTSLEAGTKADEHFLEAKTSKDSSLEWPLPTNPDNRFTES